MNELVNIQDRIFGKKGDSEENLVETFYIIMKEFGYKIQDIIGEEIIEEKHFYFFKWKIFSWNKKIIKEGLPITTFKYLIHFLNKEAKENERAMNKAGRRR